MDDYLVYSFTLDPMSEGSAEVLMALLADAGFEGFEQTETGVVAYIREAPPSPPDWGGGETGVHVSYTVERLPHRDWNAVWEAEGFRPILIGGLCAIHKPSDPVDAATDYDIVVEPRQAFGTGAHATTRMLVERLLKDDFSRLRCLDMGCGTGILAICMALRGAEQVVAIDIDPDSVANARHNLTLNRGSERHTGTQIDSLSRVIVREGDARAIEGMFDFIVANIHRNIIVADLPVYAAHLSPGGRLVVSGFFADDVPAIREAALANGLQLTDTQTDEEGWTVLEFCE